jgi:hypothetical protein
MITLEDAQAYNEFFHRSFRGASRGEKARAVVARPHGNLQIFDNGFLQPVLYAGWGVRSFITNIPAKFSKPTEFNQEKGALYECASNWYIFNPCYLCKQELWCMYQELDADFHQNFHEWPLDILKDWLLERNHHHVATVNKYITAERDQLAVAPITVMPYELGPGAIDSFVDRRWKA